MYHKPIPHYHYPRDREAMIRDGHIQPRPKPIWEHPDWATTQAASSSDSASNHDWLYGMALISAPLVMFLSAVRMHWL